MWYLGYWNTLLSWVPLNIKTATHIFFQEANDILIIPTRVLERDTGKPGAAAEATLIHETNLQRKQCSQYSSQCWVG